MRKPFGQSNQEPITLYHCLYQEPSGDRLLPLSEREVNGREGTFLFAADVLSKALAFSFSYHNGEVLFNSGIPNTDEEVVVLCGGEATLNKARHIRVYSFPNHGFEELEGARQWVSEKPVLFSDTELVLETKDIADLMKRGLQVFILNQSVDEQRQRELGIEHMSKPTSKFLRDAMTRGELTWVNRDRAEPHSVALESYIQLAGTRPAQSLSY